MNNPLNDKCAQCGKSRAKVASITQWIVFGDRCSCDTKKSGNRTVDDTSIEPQRRSASCPRCGGSLTKQDGSLTQWVFRSSPCRCVDASSTETDSAALAIEGQQEQEEYAPIEVDAGRFPSDRYTPLELIGAGQQGDVYRAKDRLLHRLVCIKVLNTPKLLPELVIRFQREAQTGGKLTHRNLTAVLDFGLTGEGQPFLVMELCSGIPLSTIIKERGPLPLGLTLEIFLQVCEGMQYAHANGVLHRDLKTGNLLVSDIDSGAPTIKIIDFGLAGLLDTTHSAEQLGGQDVLIGTPAYMSPEQVQQKRLDERSDIYSLGCALFETLTGKPVFEDESALGVLNKQVSQPPPTLSEAVPDLAFPEHLSDVLEKTLCKNPDDRFQTVAGLKSALSDLSASALEQASDIEQQEDTRIILTSSKPIIPDLKTSLIALTIILLIGAIAIGAVKSITADTEHSSSRPDKFEQHKLGDTIWMLATGNFHGPENSQKLLKCKGSTSVKIVDPNLSDSDLKYLSKLPLRNLDVSDTKISDKGLETITKIKTLEGLILNHNRGITDAGIKTLRQLDRLKVLSLKDTSATDKGVELLLKMRNLSVIDLSELKNVTGASLNCLAQLPKLYGLRLNATGVKPEDISLLEKFKSLKALAVADLDIGDPEMLILSRLDLIALDVSGNRRVTMVGVDAVQPQTFWEFNIKYTGLTDDQFSAVEEARANRPVQTATVDFVSMHNEGLPDNLDIKSAIIWYNPQMADPAFLKMLEGIVPKKKAE